MEEENKNVNVENNEVDTETTQKEVEKKFTQDEFNEALKKEVARKTKNMPSSEDLKAFKEWKDNQKTEQEKYTEIATQNKQKDSEITELKNTIAIYNSGVNSDDVDYVLFKVGKMEGDFEDNLKEFLENNPKYTEKVAKNQNATDVAKKTSTKSAESGVSAILRAKYPDLYK